MVPTMLSALVFLVVFAGFLALNRQAASPAARLSRHQAGGSRSSTAAAPAPRASIMGPLVQSGRLGTRLVERTKSDSREQARLLLQRAGSTMPLGTLLVIRFVMILVVAPLVVVLALRFLGFSLLGIGVSLAAVLVIPKLPAIVLKRRAGERASTIERDLPDALDLMVVSVEGGLSLDGALQQVGQRMDTILSAEPRHLRRVILAGFGRRDAMLALADRSQSASLRIFCTTIVQADTMGTSIANTLRTHAEMMRTRRRQ